MYTLHKCRRQRLCVKLAFVLSLFFCVLFYVCIYSGLKSENDLDALGKIKIIERNIRSIINQKECRIPDLPINNPVIMQFYTPNEKIDCGSAMDDWVMCEKSICFIKPDVMSQHGYVTCAYTDILRKTDYASRFGKSIKTEEPYVLQASDFVRVSCTAEDGLRWRGMVYGVRDGVQNTLIHKPIPPPLDNADPLLNLDNSYQTLSFFNILMLGFDSLSRNAFIRKLPKTYEYLVKQLNASILKGYNIVGDGTTQALLPLLTGYTELELPETRRRAVNAVNVDAAYPLIWNDFEQQGYITSFNEDLPMVGTFTYRLKGFKKQPVHHYLRTFYVERDLYGVDYCIGHQPVHKVMLDYTRQIMSKYSDTPKFIFSFHGELSHDSINLIGAADDDIAIWLETLKNKQFLENTILILMSDHGNRFADVRATQQGKQEERLPFFSFTFPEIFKKRFPKEYSNFLHNTNLLSTPFDIHATFKHLLELQLPKMSDKASSSSNQLSNEHEDIMLTNLRQTQQTLPNIKLSDLAKHRAISLFNIIPQNRSCAEAYIEPHWCACLNWQSLNISSKKEKSVLLKAAYSILYTINNFTQSYRTECALLQLKRINWALRLQPHHELLTFQGSIDQDGFLANMSDNATLVEEIYQLQILVIPGNGLFEASVTHDKQTMKMHAKLSQISRINKYGTQASCILEKNPDLRKYCYCKVM